MDNRPIGRQKNTDTSVQGDVYKRGEGLGLGEKVGRTGSSTVGSRPSAGSAPGSAGSAPTPAGSGAQGKKPGFGGFSGGSGGYQKQGGPSGPGRSGLGCLPILLIIAVLLFVLGKMGTSMLGGMTGGSGNQGGSSGGTVWNQPETTARPSAAAPAQTVPETAGSQGGSTAAVQTPSPGARDKFTKLKGNGQDVVTLMVYMCGSDLESKGSAGSIDLKEMASAGLSDKVNVIVYTGGSREWKISGISNTKNQIYKLETEGLKRLADDAWTGPMTDPNTLSNFIRWTAENYPADRYELIFWDHGAGSAQGFGYDENYKSRGSMKLAAINQALTDGGVKFDFVGFDACLMATLETGLMLSNHADYMIASEETEPAAGWYYTGWLNKLSSNTSIPTPELAKMIVDDYYAANERYSSMTGITQSVTDLAELAAVVPEPFSRFASSMTEMIREDDYNVVSEARRNTREFAASNKIDQVDLADLAKNVGTDEGRALIAAIGNAVLYNRTSQNMRGAKGLSVYFPYRSLRNVDDVVRTYEDIGIGGEYAECIRRFASQELTGQVSGGGTWNPYSSLFGGSMSGNFGYTGGNSSSGGSNYAGSMNADLLGELLGSVLSGDYGSLLGMGSGGVRFMDKSGIPEASEYVQNNSLDPTAIAWTTDSRGRKVLKLSEEEWALVLDTELNVLYDDGEGYLDLGLDNVFEFTEDGDLLGEYDGTWLSLNGHTVAYYHLYSESGDGHYYISGYIPAFVNGERSRILVAFTDEFPNGVITGVERHYADGETQTVPKTFLLEEGDEIDFICDYYNYDGTFRDNYYLGEQLIYDGIPVLKNIPIGDGALGVYKLTDIYNQSYWTPVM